MKLTLSLHTFIGKFYHHPFLKKFMLAATYLLFTFVVSRKATNLISRFATNYLNDTHGIDVRFINMRFLVSIFIEIALNLHIRSGFSFALFYQNAFFLRPHKMSTNSRFQIHSSSRYSGIGP